MNRAPQPNHRNNAHGFTLVEIVVVLVLASVLTSMVAPMLSPGRWRADSAVQEIMMSLNGAQRLAVLRQHDVLVTFLTDTRRLRLHQDLDNDGAIDSGEDVRVVELPETMGFGQGSAPAIGSAVGPVSFHADSAGPTLAFHRNGSASESGTAYVRPLEGSMSLDAQSVRAITVERATGEVRCFSYRTSAWEASC